MLTFSQYLREAAARAGTPALLEEILEAQGVTDKTGWNLIRNKNSGEQYLVKTVNPKVHKLVKPTRRAPVPAPRAKTRRDSPQTLRAPAKREVPAQRRDVTPLQRPRILADIPTSHFDDDGEENTRFASVRANPTRNHLQDDEAYDRTGTIGGKKNQYYFGGWLSPTTQSWYTFPRELVAHEDTRGPVRNAVPSDARASLIPIHLYVDRTGVITTIKNAPWSDDHSRSTNDIKRAVASIPSLRALTGPTTTYEVDKSTASAQDWQQTQKTLASIGLAPLVAR